MIFPDWTFSANTALPDALPLFTEWAADWNTRSFALRNGQPYTVSGTEALKIWVYRALLPQTQRFAFSAYSAAYGNQIDTLFGTIGDSGILENQLRREIHETLSVSPYITAVDNFSFSRQGSRMTVSFTVHTIYEDFEEEVRVR